MPRRLDGVDAAASDPTRRVHDQSLNAGRARLPRQHGLRPRDSEAVPDGREITGSEALDPRLR